MFGIVLDIFRSGALLGRLGDVKWRMGIARKGGGWSATIPPQLNIRRLLVIAYVAISSLLGVDTLAVVSNLSPPRASGDPVVDPLLFGVAKPYSELPPKRR